MDSWSEHGNSCTCRGPFPPRCGTISAVVAAIKFLCGWPSLTHRAQYSSTCALCGRPTLHLFDVGQLVPGLTGPGSKVSGPTATAVVKRLLWQLIGLLKCRTAPCPFPVDHTHLYVCKQTLHARVASWCKTYALYSMSTAWIVNGNFLNCSNAHTNSWLVSAVIASPTSEFVRLFFFWLSTVIKASMNHLRALIGCREYHTSSPISCSL